MGMGTFAQDNDGRIPAKGFAVFEEKGHFQPYNFSRHAVGDNDIQIEILYAGICHSDLHHVFGDWGEEEYPMVPGHEIAGRVVAVGKNVTRFKVGDYAGIGCMIGSCRHCDACGHGLEQYCEAGGSHTQGILPFFLGDVEYGHIGSKRHCILHSHVSQTSETGHADLISLLHSCLHNGRIGCYAGTKQRGDFGYVRIPGHTDGKIFGDHVGV